MVRTWLALLALIVGTHAQNSYVINTPTLIRPGLDMKVLVNILKADRPVTVAVEIWKRSGPPPPPNVDLPLPEVGVNPRFVGPPVQVKPAPLPQATVEEKITETRALVSQGEPTTLSVQLPETLSGSNFYIRVSGTGGLNFVEQKDLKFSSQSLVVFIQTDKGIYRPGQKVMFRTFAVYSDLKPYTGPIDVNVFDAQRNRIKQFNQVMGEEGVFGGEFTLSDQPVTGVWSIESRALGITETVSITVEQFVLPKFEVTVDVPSFALVTDPELVGTVEAKYTFGEAVEGSAVLRIRRDFFFPPFNQPQCQEPIIEKSLQLNGKATFRISASELEFLGRGCNGEPALRRPGDPSLSFLRAVVVKVEANVTESLTGNVQSGSDKVEFSEKQYRLQWLQSNAKNFKPGLWYDAFLKVSMMDGSPIPLNGRQLFVTLNVQASFNDGCQAFRERPTGPTTPLPKPENFPEIKMIVPNDGIIFWSNIVPKGSASVSFTAKFEGAYDTTMRVEKMDSPSDNFIQSLILTPSPKAGQSADFEILSTAPLGKVVYQIVSRGRTVRTVEIDGGNRTSFFEIVPITSAMAPSSKLVIYTVLPSGEILADSSNFNVEGVYENSVSLELSQTQAEPGDSVSVVVLSDANSMVNLLAVDQSILLLNSGNDINRETVERKMSVFDRGDIGGPFFPLFRFAVPFDGGDATAVFRNAGVTVLTDATLHVRQNCRLALFGRGGIETSVAVAPAVPPPESVAQVDQGLVQPDRVRKIFPDTWLWANMTSNADGRAVFTATVPDTITSWVTGAFAMNAVTGLGVAPTNPKLEVFLPFFVTLNLPASVVRGEEVVIQAIVFNFLPQDLSVRVTLNRSSDFQNIQIGSFGRTELTSIEKRETIQVKSGEGASVFFPIVASSLGSIELAVQAQSGVAADALVRRLRVEPEGVPQEYNIPLLIDLSPPTTSFFETRQLPFPPNVVPGSERITATVIGDLLGPTVNNLDKLLKMPSGCGEQNMITFAPDVFIMKYLSATSQLTDNIRDKATRFLEQGYQTELTYQRRDGSFSAFGNSDESGSTWLTALVLKSFCEAKPFTFIDDNVLNRAIDWIVSKQAENGSFPEVGNVIHKEMQGGSGSGLSLTAYVLCALSGKEHLSTDINVQARRSSSISRARSYLETAVAGETDIYSLSIASFALRLVNSRVADRAFDRLNRLSTVADGEKFWDVPAPPKPVNLRRNFWVPPGRTRTQDVEATSYALLNIALQGSTTEGLPVVKWLAQQRNSDGGFVSTQDTIVALQALSEYAELIYNPNTNVDVSVSTTGFRQDFAVRQSNALILQSVDIPNRPSSVSISAFGSGTAIAQISVSFNVFRDSQEPAFDIRVNLRDETINGFLIETCTTSQLRGESASGMVVQEIGLPTGFQADVNSIGKVKGLKRTETLDRKVVLYFDEVMSVPVCVSMAVERVGLVAKSQAVPIRVFQYYSPENQETIFYQSQVLRDSNFCDICADCDCRRQ